MNVYKNNFFFVSSLLLCKYFLKNNSKKKTLNRDTVFKKNNLILLNNIFLNYTYNTHKKILSSKITPGKNNFFFTTKSHLNLKKFEIFFFDYVFKKNNFIFLDRNYDTVFNLYSAMYQKKTLYKNQQFFFIRPEFMSFKNWLYFFTKFCKKNNVGLVVISDFVYFNKFVKDFTKKQIITLVFQPVDYYEINADFRFYVISNNLQFQRLMYIVYINTIFYNAIITKQNSEKKIFLKNFNKTKNILQIN